MKSYTFLLFFLLVNFCLLFSTEVSIEGMPNYSPAQVNVDEQQWTSFGMLRAHKNTIIRYSLVALCWTVATLLCGPAYQQGYHWGYKKAENFNFLNSYVLCLQIIGLNNTSS